jgi:hypothetical protein
LRGLSNEPHYHHRSKAKGNKGYVSGSMFLTPHWLALHLARKRLFFDSVNINSHLLIGDDARELTALFVLR